MDRFAPATDTVKPGDTPGDGPVLPVVALQRLFRLLDAEGMSYCLTHGYEDLPESWGSDVDIVVARTTGAERLADLFARNEHLIGARLALRDGMYFTFACAALEGVPQYLILDFSHDVKLGHLLVAGGDEVLAGRRLVNGVWIASSVVAFDVQLARALLRKRFDGKVADRLSRLFAEDPEGVSDQLRQRWPASVAGRLIEAASTRHWDAVMADAGSLRRHLLMAGVAGSPLTALSGLLATQVARAGRLLRPRGVHVVLLGPDGAGKSSTIEALEQGLGPLFTATEVRGFAPSLRQLLRRPPRSTATPHGRAPRSWGTSMLRAAYWAIHALACHVSLRWAKARSQLILNDRHFSDILVDAVRYRFGGPRWALKLVWYLTPRPDLLILLDGDPAVLQARKRELSVAETARLCRDYRKLLEGLPYGLTVNAEQPRERVVADVATAIVDALNRRNPAPVPQPRH
jgi:thymidylate kinase